MSDDGRDKATDGEGQGQASRSSLVHGTDLKLTLIILAICAAIYYVTTTFDQVAPLLAQNIPPQWFPQLLIWFIAILSLVLPFEHRFLAQGRKGLDEDRSSRIPLGAILSAGLLVLIVASIPLIGAFLALVVVCVALPLLWGERRWKILIPFAILFPTAVTLLFTKVLEVYFEPGLIRFSL
jgi:putative tricarboxylic transport membrane protein